MSWSPGTHQHQYLATPPPAPPQARHQQPEAALHGLNTTPSRPLPPAVRKYPVQHLQGLNAAAAAASPTAAQSSLRHLHGLNTTPSRPLALDSLWGFAEAPGEPQQEPKQEGLPPQAPRSPDASRQGDTQQQQQGWVLPALLVLLEGIASLSLAARNIPRLCRNHL